MKRIVLHPFLFVLLPIVASPLARASLPETVAWPMVALEVAMSLIFLFFWAVMRDALRAGVFASLVVPFVFCFAAFQSGINGAAEGLLGKTVEDAIILLLYFVFWSMIWGTVKRGAFKFGRFEFELDFSRLTMALNVMSAFLLVVNGTPTLMFQLESTSRHHSVLSQFHNEDAQYKVKAGGEQKPDVYYLILDCNAAPQVLRQIWNYDNSGFVKGLKDRGFCVVPQAFSNYDRTALSIPSSLNMQYIDVIPEKFGRDFNDDTLNYRLMQDNRLARLLKQNGYKYVNIFSGFQPTEFVPFADVNFIKSPGSNHLLNFLQLTPLWGTETYLPVILDMYAETRLVPYKYGEQIAAIPGPKFVLIHSLLSHPPNVFDENGNRNELSRALLNEKAPDGYLKQIKFTEKEVLKLLDVFMSRPGPKPVIVIQSDHGPMFRTPDDVSYYNENMPILLAYHFPANSDCKERLSPVNVFRLMFNQVFGSELPLLPDRAFCNPNISQDVQYKWTDVTDKLVFPGAQADLGPKK